MEQNCGIEPTSKSLTQLYNMIEEFWYGMIIVDAHYGPISTVNLTKKLGELTFLAGIFIQSNVDSTRPLEKYSYAGI
jgi:hypothetical protein